jgi:hypothetical protein
MNPGVVQFRFLADQTDFTGPNAVMEVPESRRLRIWINRLASRAAEHEPGSVGHVSDLAHEIKPREPVITRRFSEIRPKISLRRLSHTGKLVCGINTARAGLLKEILKQQTVFNQLRLI